MLHRIKMNHKTVGHGIGGLQINPFTALDL